MFDRELDAVPWANLQQCFGSAGDVPRLLRAMRFDAPRPESGEPPVWDLFHLIWHQHTIYEATAYAVPFLIDLAADPRTPDRELVLMTLASIAAGRSYLDVHGNVLRSPNFEAELARELADVARAYAAVAAGYDTYMNLTADADGTLRLAAADVLSLLPAQDGRVEARLDELLRNEREPLYRAGLVLILGRLAASSERARERVLAAARASEERERTAALFAIARRGIRPLDPSLRAAMEKLLADSGRSDRLLSDLPWITAYDVHTGYVIDFLASG
jgi:hypothetical protein